MAATKRISLASAAGSALLAVALMLAAAPQARAGAVFEIRETIPTNADAYKFQFNDLTTAQGLGSIVRSGKAGAGAVFATSAIPLAIFTLNRCTAVAPHIHPNAAETVFVLQGKFRVTQFRGEEDGSNVRVVEAGAGEAVYIQQGAYHTVENISKGTSQFLQIFDHPQAGAVFASAALAALPRNVVNSSFSSPVLPDGVTGRTGIISVQGCNPNAYSS